MITIQDIETKLRTLNPTYLEITDQTALHQDHYTGPECGVTHIKITIQFEDPTPKSLVAAHRLVYAALSDIFNQGLHAVEITLL